MEVMPPSDSCQIPNADGREPLLMRKLIVDTSAVRRNLARVRKQAGDAVLYAVLSGDARGTDLLQMAALLREEGVRRFAVADAEEAETLRKAGFVDEELLMLRATTDQRILNRLIDLNVVCTISSVDTGLALNALAERRATVVPAHILVDTGMGSGGFLVSEPEKILLAYRSLPSIALEGIYTQLRAVKPCDPEALAQLDRFESVLELVHEAGFETGIAHAADSFSLLHCPDVSLDGVRVGSALLGRCKRTRDDELELVGYGEAPLTEIRWLPKGHTILGDKPLVLKRPTRVALIPVGYRNGFGIALPPSGGYFALRRWRKRLQKQFVRIDGHKAKLVGTVGASSILVNVTKIRCSAGDVARFDLDPMFAKGFTVVYE